MDQENNFCIFTWISVVNGCNFIFNSKQNKRLSDNKSWELPDPTVSCMNQWLCVYVCATAELASFRIKNKSTEDYIQKYNRRPSCEEKKWYNFINIGATENAGNVYHNTSQNLHFDHAA